jgi:hypothetical protein
MRKLIIYISLLMLAIAGLALSFQREKLHAKRVTAKSLLVAPLRVSPATTPGHPASSPARLRPSTTPEKQVAMSSYLQLPLDFEANEGQAPARFDFVAHGLGYSLGLSPGVATLSLQHIATHTGRATLPVTLRAALPEPVSSTPLELRLVGANPAAVVSGAGEQSGRSNYFIGNDPSNWHRAVPHFNRVKMAGVYPGVDLVFYGNPQQLENDFLVSPGADPKTIRLKFSGARRVHLDDSGNAVLHTPAGEVQLKRPVSYQEVGGVRTYVNSHFKIEAGRELRFELGPYDRSKPLVIDPVLMAAVSLGGSNGTLPNVINGVELDASGNVYVAGATCATDFPSTAGPFQNIHANVSFKNCLTTFVTKLDPALSTLIYSDFIGGSDASAAWYLAVDGPGNVFLSGSNNSTDFPTVNNVGKTTPPAPCMFSKTNAFNCPDAYVLKLNSDGSQLIFSSLLGGSQASIGDQIQLNPVTKEVVVMGWTNSADFRPAPTTLLKTFPGGACAGGIPCFETFVYGFDPNTGAVRYGTFLGGTKNNLASGLAVDSAGGIYVAGSTQPPFATGLGSVTHTFPPAHGASAGGSDIFVMELNVSALNALSVGYITLIQGEADDALAAITEDSLKNAYLIGGTASQDLPVTAGVFQSTNTDVNGSVCGWGKTIGPFLPNACGSIFVGKLGPAGTLSFLTYLGGTGPDIGEAIGLDSLGNLWLAGITSSSNFPFSSDAYLSLAGGTFVMTPFLAQMSTDGTKLPFATPLTSGFGQVTDITTDGSGNIFITGFASTVPSTPGVYPANPQVFQPAFLQKWNGTAQQPVLQLSATTVQFPDTPIGAISTAPAITVTNAGGGPMEINIQIIMGIGAISLPTDFLESDNCGSSLAAHATCSINVTFAPGPPDPICANQPNCNTQGRGAQILVLTNAPASPNSPNTISVGGEAGNGAILSLTPNPIVFPGQQPAGTTSAGLNVSILNSGDVKFTISNFAITGTNSADFSFSPMGGGGQPCNNPIAPATLCGMQVTFNPAPTATGTRTAQLVLTSNSEGSPQSIPLTGTVSGATALNVSPTTIAIGPAAIGTTGSSNLGDLTLSNPTTTAVQVSAFNISGTNMGDFTINKATCPSLPPFSLAGGASCFVQVEFGPGAGPSGLRTAMLTITSPQVAGIPPVPLTGAAVSNTDPAVTLFIVPNPMNFGGVQLGQSTNNLLSNLVNINNTVPIPCAGGAPTCGGPLKISALMPGLSDYAVSLAGGAAYCTAPPLTIPSGGSCLFQVVFTPAAAGNRNSSFMIISNAPQGPVTVPLFGTGLALPIVQVTPSSINFGNSEIGSTSPPQLVTLQNTGRGPLNPTIATTPANFTVSANNCTAQLAPGASCTISITFTPPSAGPFSGTLMLANNAAFGGQQAVGLSGSGAAGALLLIAPTSIDFGNQPSNTVSLTQSITLTSTGSAAVTLPTGALRISAPFLIASSTCGSSLSPGASCTVGIQFKPTGFFFQTGSLLISNNARGNPQTVSFVGDDSAGGAGSATVTLNSSMNPVAAGQPVTFTARISPQTNRTPTGTMLFLDGINTIGSVPLNLSSNGMVSFTTSSLTAGSHSITAAFPGNFAFQGATSPILTQVVSGAVLATSMTAVQSSLNPSAVGQSVMFTATVTSISPGTPTGTVTFFDGVTQLGMGTLNGQAKATFMTTTLTAGSHSITGQYGGDTSFSGSTSPILTQTVNAAVKLSTTTAVSSSLNPSTVGQSVTFTATVTSASPGTPTGMVAFFDGVTQIGTGTLNAQAMASFMTTTLTTGSHSITAQYAGDANFGGSTSPLLMQTVNASTKAATTTAVISSANPSIIGQSVTFTATVTSGAAGTPTGTVTFFDGVTQIGVGMLNAQAKATFMTTTLVAGSHPISAQFAGDANFATSTSAPLTETINNPVPILSSISPTTAPVNTPITVTATWSGFVNGATVIFGGTSNPVTVTNNGTMLTANISASELVAVGSVNVTISNPTPGGGGSTSLSFVIDDFSVTGPVAPVSVPAGQPAIFPLNFGTQGGTLATGVSLSVEMGLPADATATFTPSSFPAGSISGASTLKITTMARPGAAAPAPASLGNWPRIHPLTLIWLALFALTVWLAQRVRQAERIRMRLRITLALLALSCVMVGVAGCGSGGGNGNTGTPAGTFPILVKATAGPASRTVTVMLKVQ